MNKINAEDSGYEVMAAALLALHAAPRLEVSAEAKEPWWLPGWGAVVDLGNGWGANGRPSRPIVGAARPTPPLSRRSMPSLSLTNPGSA
jgi:hypothetical protein